MIKKLLFILSIFLMSSLSLQALTITGTVTNANNNNPIVGAIVTLQTMGGGGINTYRDTTIAGGVYSLLNIPVGTSGVLTVTATGYTQNQQFVQNLRANDTIDIQLIPAGTQTGAKKILGTVSDASSLNAVSSARLILLLNAGGTATPVDTVISANNGSYLFDSLSSGRYTIVVTKSGYSEYTSNIIDLRTADSAVVNIQLTPIGKNVGTLTGKVTATDTQVVISGAKVLLTRTVTVGGTVTTTPIDSTLTNNNGIYTISNVPAATGYRLTVSAENYITVTSATFRVDSGVTRTQNFALQAYIPPSGIVKGTVVDSASLAAIQGAQVVLRSQNAAGGWTAIDTTQTASNGSFAFTGLDIGTYSLVVSKAEYQTYTTPLNRAIQLTTNSDTATVTIALVPVPKGNLHVFVADASNNAISQASVSIVQRLTGGSTGSTYNALTGSNGWVSFMAIVAGNYDITVAKSGYNTITSANHTVTANGNDTVKITLQQATGSTKVVKGTIKTSTGASVASAVVVLTARTGAGATLSLVDTANSNGAYEIDGIPVGYTTASLRITATGYQTKDTSNISIANDTTTVNITLLPIVKVLPVNAKLTTKFTATVINNLICITGAIPYVPVKVVLYSANGKVIMSKNISSDSHIITLPKIYSKQILFLKAQQQSRIINQRIVLE